MTYQADENGNRTLCFGDSEESYLVEKDENSRIPTVQMILINNLDGTVVNVGRFDESLRVTE